MSRRFRIALALGVALALVVGAAAYAYYTASGSGQASASVGTLGAPTITNATAGAGSVSLTWSAVTPPGPGSVAYYVKRDGGAPSAACPSAASPSGVTSCTDTGVSVATHSYTVTAVWRSWSGTSSSTNVSVTSGAVTQLVYSTQPTGATGGTAFTTQPVVTAKDAGGNTVTSYSGTINLSIKSGTGSAGAALSGCSGNLVNGVTTFSGCKIDKSGSNYKLTASDGTRTVDSNNFDVTVGAVAQLAFTQQPAGAVAGAAFTTQPKVTAQDAGGNTVTSYAGTITLSITSGTGSAGATLDNCSRSTSNGVATFSNCEIKKSGSGYQLHASDGTRAADSAAFTVTPGAMASLSFTTQPSGGTGGTAFATQPVVTALDAEGNVATGYSGTITLTIRTPGPTGTLHGCSQSRSNGVVTFSGCAIDEANTGYRLRAKDGTPQVDSNTFDVTVGPLAQIAFTTQPSGATAGSAFTTQPKVTARDAGGNTVTSYAGTVTLTIGTNPGGGTLSGCSSTRTNGVTSFSGCKIDKSGVGYVLHASDGSLAADSNSFTVVAGTATTLLFTTQPSGATGGTDFTTQPKVTAYDANGNVATTYSGNVNLSIKSGTGTAGASLNGCNDNVSAGVVTFSGCDIDKAGTGYVLRATEGAKVAESAAFDVTVGPFDDVDFTTSPSGAVAGTAFTTQPVVAAVDAGGNVVTSFAGTVTLAIRSGTGTSGAVLSGCSGSLSNGVTTFSGCKIDKSGSGYQLRATAGSDTDDSSSFSVSAGSAVAFVLDTDDATPTAGSGNDVTVTAVDAFGNTATSYTGSKSITFAGAGAGPGSGTLPTVVNSSGSAIAFGSATTLSFSNGVSSTSSSSGTLTLRKAETANVTATDGTLSTSSALAIAVSAGSAVKLAWTSVTLSAGTPSALCMFACTVTSIGDNGTFTARVSATDTDGNVVGNVGTSKTISLSRTSGSGTFTAPSSGTSTSLTISSGSGTSSATFTFKAPASSWSSTAFKASNASYTDATATLNR
ncbi:MAG: hypothetical protein WBC33_07870 [Conexibacter sp.]